MHLRDPPSSTLLEEVLFARAVTLLHVLADVTKYCTSFAGVSDDIACTVQGHNVEDTSLT